MLVEIARILNRGLDGLLRNLGKDHPLHGHLRLQQLAEMPADALPFAVFVRRKNQDLGPFQRRLQLPDERLLFLRDHVVRLELRFGVDAESRPRLALLHLRGDLGGARRKIADVAHAGHHSVVAAQILADLSRLGRRFDDHQPLHFFPCHKLVLPDCKAMVDRGCRHWLLALVSLEGPAKMRAASRPNSVGNGNA